MSQLARRCCGIPAAACLTPRRPPDHAPCRHTAHETKAPLHVIFTYDQWESGEKGQIPQFGYCPRPGAKRLFFLISVCARIAVSELEFICVSVFGKASVCERRSVRPRTWRHGAPGGRPPECRLAPGQSGGSISTILTSVLRGVTS